MVYTNQGIYCIEDKILTQLEPHDKDIEIFANYHEQFTLIADCSYFRKIQCSSLHGDTHYSICIEQHIHKLTKQGRVELIIEYVQGDNMSVKQPHDLYFRVPENTDPNVLFIKQELIEFLSMLN